MKIVADKNEKLKTRDFDELVVVSGASVVGRGNGVSFDVSFDVVSLDLVFVVV